MLYRHMRVCSWMSGGDACEPVLVVLLTSTVSLLLLLSQSGAQQRSSATTCRTHTCPLDLTGALQPSGVAPGASAPSPTVCLFSTSVRFFCFLSSVGGCGALGFLGLYKTGRCTVVEAVWRV